MVLRDVLWRLQQVWSVLPCRVAQRCTTLLKPAGQ